MADGVLLEGDQRFLETNGYRYDVTVEDGMTCLVLHDVPLPRGFDRDATDILMRLPPGFPDAQPDMFWCDPPLRFATGQEVVGSDAREVFLSRDWQRFSRHLAPGAWRPGRDNLQSWLMLILDDLARAGS